MPKLVRSIDSPCLRDELLGNERIVLQGNIGVYSREP